VAGTPWTWKYGHVGDQNTFYRKERRRCHLFGTSASSIRCWSKPLSCSTNF